MSVEQTVVRVRALTPAGWFVGGLPVPTKSTVLDYLNRAGQVVRMSDVSLQGHSQVLPFVGVHRDAMALVLPDESAPVDAAPPAQGSPNEVAGVLASAMFHGTVGLADNMRVSDFFAGARGFVAVRDCQVWMGEARGATSDKSLHAVALIHSPSIIAVSDTLS